MEGSDISKSEFTAIVTIQKKAALNSDFWSLQTTLLRECQITKGTEAAYRSLGITPSVRVQRDPKNVRLDQYAKSMLSMERAIQQSLDLESNVTKEKVKGTLLKCCVRDAVKEAVFKQTHVLQAGVASVFEGQIKEVQDILATMSTHTQDLDLAATSWKLGIKDANNAEEVLEKAGVSIATLKGGLVQTDFKNLREAMTRLEQSMSKYGGLYEKNIIEGDGYTSAESTMADANARVVSVKVLMLESCLHLGLATSNKAILTSQIAKISGGEIDEQAVCGALLSKARELELAARQLRASLKPRSVLETGQGKLLAFKSVQSDRLSDLLMCDFGTSGKRILEGVSFTRYVVPQEQQRLEDFLSESSKGSTPARSLHLQLKDSSGIPFNAELFHVSVPSLTSEQPEHLIGLNQEVRERTYQTGAPSENPAQLAAGLNGGLSRPSLPMSDMRQMLDSKINFGNIGQRRAEGEASATRSSTKSSRTQDVVELRMLEKVDCLLTVNTDEDDFAIKTVQLSFRDADESTRAEVPYFLEWVKPTYRDSVQNWIQAHVNAHFSGLPTTEHPLRGTKLFSPFTSADTMLSGLMEVCEVEEVDDESVEHLSDAGSGSGSGSNYEPTMQVRLQMKNLFVH
ncbi:unnamed protein product [Symbiodinium sp. CCMP2592]|nr:unnamed protein product [Symbiodinium sp. CCMP2592]